jgi:isocitrate lyase
MGYKFQFVTLAGFHALNHSMFDLARGYRTSGMSAYSELQEREFASENDGGYRAVKHQRFVGTGYFDEVAQTIAAGKSSTTALSGSTEAKQFAHAGKNGHANGNGNPKTSMPPAPPGNGASFDLVSAT